MAGYDVFSGDLFSLTEMTAAINKQESVPGRLAELGYFEEKGVATLSVFIERKEGRLQLVSNKERNTPGQNLKPEARNAIPFKPMHLPQEEFIWADEVQGVRMFGTENQLATVEAVRDEKLARMRNNIDATTEFHRVGALKGQILDADGTTVIEDLYERFGLTKTSKSLGLNTTGKGDNDFRVKARELKRISKKALGGNVVVPRWRAICGIQFFDKFVAHEEIKAAWNRFNESEMLRNDPTGGFSHAGIFWEDYDGSIGDEYLIPEDKAYLVPEGVAGLFLTRFAPANRIDTVNTIGLPYYAWSDGERPTHVKLVSQSNPLHICTVPPAVIELTL